MAIMTFWNGKHGNHPYSRELCSNDVRESVITRACSEVDVVPSARKVERVDDLHDCSVPEFRVDGVFGDVVDDAPEDDGL